MGGDRQRGVSGPGDDPVRVLAAGVTRQHRARLSPPPALRSPVMPASPSRRPFVVACMAVACVAAIPTACSPTDPPDAVTPAPAADAPAAVASHPALQAFEASAWCKQHRCRLDDSWDLRTGGKNYSYDVSNERAMPDLSIRGDSLVGAGLMVTGAREDDAGTTALLTGFLGAIAGECPAGTRQIAQGWSIRVSQIDKAPAARCGPWRVRAGRVHPDIVLSLDRR